MDIESLADIKSLADIESPAEVEGLTGQGKLGCCSTSLRVLVLGCIFILGFKL
jgi:hypothetical protein